MSAYQEQCLAEQSSACAGAECWHHRDTYLEQLQTVKLETEMRDVDRIRMKKMCTHAVQGGLLGGHKSAPVRQKHMLPARPETTWRARPNVYVCCSVAGTQPRCEPKLASEAQCSQMRMVVLVEEMKASTEISEEKGGECLS